MEAQRIIKLLAQHGLCSRREAETWISEAKVKLNGKLVTEPGQKMILGKDSLVVKGKVVHFREPPRVYWLFNKPDKYLTAAKPQDGKPCIFSLPKLTKLPFTISPVGRLDYRTEGLLILSNDGELVFRLSHPKYKVEREYQTMVSRKLTMIELRQLKKGIELEDGLAKEVDVEFLQAQSGQGKKGYWYTVIVREGRNRLVRRLFESFDIKVLRLVRVGFGDIRLDLDLEPGNYRQLSAKEIGYLKKSVDLKPVRGTKTAEGMSASPAKILGDLE